MSEKNEKIDEGHSCDKGINEQESQLVPPKTN